MSDIIKTHRDQGVERVFLCVDSIGKEELMESLSVFFNTLIVVNE